ncbi:ATP-binding cassette domain-containing protein [Clostridium sp. YIM B02505]|uniref:ATP-binding cassette domain-containing protein n=1 Tax=Clostridium yunnanense TaxID=2800325 RepID=A0ABS1EX07_9CLOT|nr:ATP-binding cassette domain-containing protein [Clostridium yunnanense]MBK1813828.1 ATP-binding cassette domain-containing protein [Clostridium yunnanense]
MIVLENVCKEFKTVKKQEGLKGAFKGLFSRDYTLKKAVDNMTFTINKGEIVGYIGANGAGKSTTIKMMTGILTPSSGKVTVDGIVPYENRTENAKKIGVVFGQRTQLWWDLALRETFTVLKEIYEVSNEDFEYRMKFLDDVLGLDEFMATPVRSLSLGQRMRADLAASLLHNPQILYLDEPTIGLDVMVKEKVRKAIKEINKEFGTTVILTTHDLNDIEELCNRIIIIDNGKKIYDGSIEAIKSTFGYMSQVEIKVKSTEVFKSFDINKSLNFSKEDLFIEEGDGSVIVTFNKNKIPVSDIIYVIMKECPVIDVSIKETSIEEIIKKIYRNEVNV